MEKIVLSKPIMLGDKEIKEIELDFSKITGRVMINCERVAKKKDATITLPALSMIYQAFVGAEAAGINIETILDLAAPDFTALTTLVQNFLINTEQTQV